MEVMLLTFTPFIPSHSNIGLEPAILLLPHDAFCVCHTLKIYVKTFEVLHQAFMKPLYWEKLMLCRSPRDSKSYTESEIFDIFEQQKFMNGRSFQKSTVGNFFTPMPMR